MGLKGFISAHKSKPVYKIGLGGFTLGICLGLSMILLTPQQLGPFGITAWFAVLFLVVGSLLGVVISSWRKFRGTYQSLRKVLRHSGLLAFWLVALLALYSLRQLNVLDVLLLTVFIGLFEFYARKR